MYILKLKQYKNIKSVETIFRFGVKSKDIVDFKKKFYKILDFS